MNRRLLIKVILVVAVLFALGAGTADVTGTEDTMVLEPDRKTGLWVADSLSKIRPGDKKPKTSHVWDGAGILLKSARNEYEACQIVLCPAEDLRQVEVAITDLKGPGGKTIEKKNVRFYWEYYVDIKVASGTYENGEYIGSMEGYPAQPPEKFQGQWPDALVPLTRPFTVLKNQTQPVWMDLHVPKDVPAGKYQGEITVSFTGGKQKIPLGLIVWDFTLPSGTHLRSIMGEVNAEFIARYHEIDIDENTKGFPVQLQEMLKTYYCFLAEHRVAPSYLEPLPEVSISGNEVKINFESSDRMMCYVLDELGANTTRIYISSGWPPLENYKPLSERYNQLLKKVLRQTVDHYRAKGWLDKICVFVEYADEPGSKEEYENVRQWAKLVKSAIPEVKFCVTEQPQPEDPGWGTLFGYADWWDFCLPGLDEGSVKSRRDSGEIITWYTSVLIYPLPELVIDREAIEPRIIFWMTFKYGIEGFNYFFLNFWDLENPWQNPLSWDSNRVYGRRAGRKRNGDYYNGCGSLLYPGSLVQEYTAQTNVDGPVASLRLKEILQGIEDYEYLYLLTELGGGKEAREIADTMVTSIYEYQRSPRQLYLARECAAEAILQRQAKGKNSEDQENFSLRSP